MLSRRANQCQAQRDERDRFRWRCAVHSTSALYAALLFPLHLSSARQCTACPSYCRAVGQGGRGEGGGGEDKERLNEGLAIRGRQKTALFISLSLSLSLSLPFTSRWSR